VADALIGLTAAVVAVTGTLAAPVISQRLMGRVQREEFERQQRLAEAEWSREQQVAELDRRRDCYASVNAVFRGYRTQLLNFLWTVHKAEVTPQARETLEEARHTAHATHAEAQMIASPAVLAELDGMSKALSETYRRIMCLEEGTPDLDGSFDDIRADFQRLWERWDAMLSVMRADLGVGSQP
jgi:hypothetical protein